MKNGYKCISILGQYYKNVKKKKCFGIELLNVQYVQDNTFQRDREEFLFSIDWYAASRHVTFG